MMYSLLQSGQYTLYTLLRFKMSINSFSLQKNMIMQSFIHQCMKSNLLDWRQENYNFFLDYPRIPFLSDLSDNFCLRCNQKFSQAKILRKQLIAGINYQNNATKTRFLQMRAYTTFLTFLSEELYIGTFTGARCSFNSTKRAKLGIDNFSTWVLSCIVTFLCNTFSQF